MAFTTSNSISVNARLMPLRQHGGDFVRKIRDGFLTGPSRIGHMAL